MIIDIRPFCRLKLNIFHPKLYSLVRLIPNLRPIPSLIDSAHSESFSAQEISASDRSAVPPYLKIKLPVVSLLGSAALNDLISDDTMLRKLNESFRLSLSFI